MLYYPQMRIPSLFLLFSVLTASNEDPWGSYFSRVAGWTWILGLFFFVLICSIAACSYRFAQLSRLDAEMITGTQWSDEMFRKMHKTHLYEDPKEPVYGTKLLGLGSSVTQLCNVVIKVERVSAKSNAEVNSAKSLMSIPEVSSSEISAEEEKRFEARTSNPKKTFGGSEMTLQHIDSGNIAEIDRKHDNDRESILLSLKNIRTDSESQANLEKLRSAILEEENAMALSPTIDEQPVEEYFPDAGDETDELGVKRVKTSYLNLEEKVNEWPSLGEASRAVAEISVDAVPQRRLRETSTEK